jgi:(p)ppGpp synthase/HD superfamily hydrolase
MKSDVNADQSMVYQQTVYQITGFDRLNFVGDVTNAIPQDDYCRITGLSFEGDGIRVDGRMTVCVRSERHLSIIARQLRAIRGVVSIRQTS